MIGLALAVMLFKRRATPKPVVVTHGAVAATALVLLFLHNLRNPQSLFWVAIALFVVAALGGVILFANDLRQKPGPLPLVVVHALVAATALALVLVGAFGQ